MNNNNNNNNIFPPPLIRQYAFDNIIDLNKNLNETSLNNINLNEDINDEININILDIVFKSISYNNIKRI